MSVSIFKKKDTIFIDNFMLTQNGKTQFNMEFSFVASMGDGGDETLYEVLTYRYCRVFKHEESKIWLFRAIYFPLEVFPTLSPH